MGCCCFSTLRGAAFFVASIHISFEDEESDYYIEVQIRNAVSPELTAKKRHIHAVTQHLAKVVHKATVTMIRYLCAFTTPGEYPIYAKGAFCFSVFILEFRPFSVVYRNDYYGLQHLLKFIIFPAVFTFLHSTGDARFIGFLPGMGYAILYFILGCAIFRGIENESIRAIKWNALGFTVLEIMFFVLRVILGVIPTPTVPDMPKSDQPFKWDIYKTLHYFMFTIVGGLVYLCILFLYVQKLGAGHDEFAQLFNLPLTVNPPASNPLTGVGGGSNSNATGCGRSIGGGVAGTGGAPSLINHADSPKRTFLPPPPQLINLNNNKPSQQTTDGDSNKKVIAPIGGGLPKEPTPPGSPLSPYFLLSNQNSCANVVTSANNKLKHEPAEEPLWHQPRVQSVPMVNHRSSPQLDRIGVAVSAGNGNGAHPPRAYHLGHEQIPPLIPPFPDPEGSVTGRNGSFGPVDFGSPIGSELGMPPYPPHLHQAHHGIGIPGLSGHQPEPHYQKIPLSPDFSYCLR